MTWSRTVVSAIPPKAPLTESRPSTRRELPVTPVTVDPEVAGKSSDPFRSRGHLQLGVLEIEDQVKVCRAPHETCDKRREIAIETNCPRQCACLKENGGAAGARFFAVECNVPDSHSHRPKRGCCLGWACLAIR